MIEISVAAVDRVSFDLAPSTIMGLIGPNGSGKTTLLNVLNGVHKFTAGEIRLRGASLKGLRPHALVARGVSRTFQNPHVFDTVTVFQNMLVPMLHHRDGRSGRIRDRAGTMLEFVGLSDFRNRAASELSGGQQKLLEFARALMSEPVLILMDEPFAGIHPEIKALLIERIARTRENSGTSFIIVSHEIPDLLMLSDAVVCMAAGRVISSGRPAEVAADERVVEAYLGHGISSR
jgi:ABC-type branched-subunit amino acid transport system ATPase component